MRNIVILAAFAVIFLYSCKSEDLKLDEKVSESVEVAGGKVEGTLEDDIYVFRGIPFAAPPVGDLRWKAPQPVQAWDGVFNTAGKFAPSCPQQKMIPGADQLEFSEDCLYLNIWTPAKTTGEKLPVMVWIYGGGFAMGSASLAQFHGDELAKRGVIVVTVGYRVGALGFLAHPELTAESPDHVSGNYGLLDQIAALQWVQKNIETFGGDPARVTVFGESAGGFSVSMLCASPLAKGLFSGAISESGGSFGPVLADSVRFADRILPSQADQALQQGKLALPHDIQPYLQPLRTAELKGADFAKRMGATTIAELRQMPADKFVDDLSGLMGGFWPVVDGHVIVGDQYKLYEQGKYNDVDVLIGTNSDEGSLFAIEAEGVEEYQTLIRERFGTFADRILAAYPATTVEETYTSATDIFRETIFAWPTYAWAKLQSTTGKKSKVYLYYFDQPQPSSPRGAAHGSEIDYVFGHLTGDRTINDAILSDIIMKYWTNFAKYGDPNGENLPEWGPYNTGNPSVMLLKDNPHTTTDLPHQDKLLLMEDFFKDLRTARGE